MICNCNNSDFLEVSPSVEFSYLPICLRLSTSLICLFILLAIDIHVIACVYLSVYLISVSVCLCIICLSCFVRSHRPAYLALLCNQ
jgi:hypothetical protein